MDDAVGNSLGVRRELAKGIRSLPRWRKGVHRKKTETRQKIVRVAEKLAGVRKVLKFGRCSGSSSGVHQDFTEGIEKIARNTLGDRQKKTVRLVTRMVEAVGLAEVRSLL
ncbi:hypothetical protein GW17_00053087 [Ensete ventricosum]|nr:hypothetical protein GW17_00053087 [Ensete ventricosum]